MKKVFILVVVLLVVFVSFSAVYALSSKKTITITYRDIQIFINGELKPTDKEPFIYDSTTYVPLRFLSENLGYVVNWDGTKNAITIDIPKNVTVQENKPVAYADIEVEQFPPSNTTKEKIYYCKTDAEGNFSFTLAKEDFLNMKDEVEVLMTIKIKDPTQYLLSNTATNKLIVKIQKANGPTYSFVLLYQQEKNKLKSNKGYFLVNAKTQN